MIETAEITKNVAFESKKLVDYSKHRNKKRSKKYCVLIFKKDIQKKKETMLQQNLENISKNQAFQRTTKFIEMKGIVVLVQVSEMHNILNCLLCHWLFVKILRGIG